MNLHQQIEQYFTEKAYGKAAGLCEQIIASEPSAKTPYWFLGLARLMQGQETEAQITWFMAITDGESENIDQWTIELIQILETEANRQACLEDFSLAWTIRQHLRELAPTHINNLLHIVALSCKKAMFTPDNLTQLGVLAGLKSHSVQVDEALLLHVLEKLLEQVPAHPLLVEFAEVSRSHISDPSVYVQIVLTAALKIAYFGKQPDAAAYLAEFCLEAQPNQLEVLFELSAFYQNARKYQQGIEVAKKCLELADNLPDQTFASYLLLRSLMNAGGYWKEAIQTLDRHDRLLEKLLQTPPIPLDLVKNARLNVVSFFSPYVRDLPRHNRYLQEQVFKICQANMQFHNQHYVEKYTQSHVLKKTRLSSPKKLKIGYLSQCFYEHSVGWLARWLLQHHDREQFELYLYFLTYCELNDSLQPQFFQLADHARKLGADRIEVAESIAQDDIDILIDLDSVTLDVGCNVLSLKPAPIQVTWLGWDAIGLSTVDYFIADPYVLPEYAQEYYTETIFRLPKTYIAVDGFEVATPTLRRDQLEIPQDAIVYLSAQRGYKRHRDTARFQMKILQQVDNSYFLVKGLAEQTSIQSFFIELAEEEGVDSKRLRFLPEVPVEAIHRANLGIADVVLDTYPYNGATTTLETLWMGIPLVTRVGEQFAARNSYTMLMNVGVQEGIAWTDEEYVEWGVRFGTDEALRQQVHWKLRQSRHTAPLWNAKQFTRDMENAYQQMWQIYCEGGKRV